MFKIDCVACGRELDEPIALLFSGPIWSHCCKKDHLCHKCYVKVLDYIKQLGDNA